MPGWWLVLLAACWSPRSVRFSFVAVRCLGMSAYPWIPVSCLFPFPSLNYMAGWYHATDEFVLYALITGVCHWPCFGWILKHPPGLRHPRWLRCWGAPVLGASAASFVLTPLINAWWKDYKWLTGTHTLQTYRSTVCGKQCSTVPVKGVKNI